MNKTNWINHAVVDEFKKGDRVGLPFEGCTLFPQDRDLLHGAGNNETVEAFIDVVDTCDQNTRERLLGCWKEKRMQLALNSTQGSDESSIVDNFLKFAEGYTYTTREQFVWDWLNYHQQHHATGYGRTYRDHFHLVAHVRRHGDKYPDLHRKISKLAEIAVDADSHGNGALALCYPAHCYARTIGEDPSEFVRYLTGFTHSHRDAMEAVTRLSLFIEDPTAIADFHADACIADDELFRQRFCTGYATAFNTLVAAVKCAVKDTEMEVIREGLRIGGDTDSVLATAMLLWALQH